MKNKTGFTIVELLAVIVLLAAIMILVYPNVLEKIREQEKGIDDKTEQLLYQSTYNYLYNRKGTYPLLTGNQYCVKISTLSYEDELIVDAYDDLFNTGYVQVEIGNNGDTNQDKNAYRIITSESLCQGTVIKTTISDSNDTSSEIVYLDGVEIYFNPETGKVCNSSEVVSTKEATSGCMKWYTFGDASGNSTIKMILDHKTTDLVAFNSTGATTMNEIKTELAVDIASWNSDIKSTASLISVDELSKIVGKDMALGSWNYFNDDSFAWLYENNPVDSLGDGYWTSTVKEDYILVVSIDGYTTASNPDEEANYGIRPVITVSKSALQ